MHAVHVCVCMNAYLCSKLLAYVCACLLVYVCACVLLSAGKSPLVLEPQGDGRQTTSALQSDGKLCSYYVPVLERDFTVLFYTQPRPQH